MEKENTLIKFNNLCFVFLFFLPEVNVGTGFE